MKIIEKGFTPDGIELQLEDWSDDNTEECPDLYGKCISAYPIAKNSGRYSWVRSGERFRLSIDYNKYSGYTNEMVAADYEALKNGTKTIYDLSDNFDNGDEDKWYLGMDVEYKEY